MSLLGTLVWIASLQGSTLTPSNFLKELSPGINLGNTLEAIPTETAWGNPKPTQAYFDAVKKAGFNSVRIPVAYSQYSDAENKIDPKWLDHVFEVAQMARKSGLVAIVNLHWDGGWLQPIEATAPQVNAKFVKFWKQIGGRFQNADARVILAGTNEVHIEGDYGAPSPENARMQNGFNQLFVSTIRGLGGKHMHRFLVVQTYNTDIGHGLKHNRQLPKDPTQGRLAMEVHFYSPYNFALNEKSEIWQWGKGVTDAKAAETWGNEDHVDEQFAGMQSAFVKQGVPVILGEYGAYPKPKFPGMPKFTLRWNAYVTRSAIRHGMVPMYWDTGALFNRSTGAIKDPLLLKSLILQKAD